MKKILNSVLSVFSLLAIVGCNTTGNKLQLIVANEDVKYVDTSHTAEYTYKNDTIRKKATNIITYTISNPTDKKYLLVFDTEFPEPMFSDKVDYVRAFIGYSIFSDKNLLKKYNPGIIDSFSESCSQDCESSQMINRINEYEKLGITPRYTQEVYNYLHNSVTIIRVRKEHLNL